ncbi:UNKNOWN [Stylonychia lemnae]|uniref:NADP-dependent oxidoreductase domain-containing protein n=1 Tax=Stylonychia lemnae TaxID=5949 RepID=A0A078AS93_STYLE|nr:UNKNOWN [Stylonychia lemnae]|eukprot:CDW84836.1 UNKNOWN [Stylonychia lemnae]
MKEGRFEAYDEFLDNYHDYEVYLQDECPNPQFNLTKENLIQRQMGHCTTEGTQRYFQRNQEQIHPDNFTSIQLGRNQLTLSKMMMGTAIGQPDKLSDVSQYFCNKLALISGGMNQIDTATFFRSQKAERIVGAVLNTLVQKYRFQRDEFFINSKQGVLIADLYENEPQELLIQDILTSGNVQKEDIIGDIYSIHPHVLQMQLENTLERLNIETLDVALLFNPHELAQPFLTKKQYQNQLLRAFDFYEKQIQQGRIRYYGLSGEDSLMFNVQRATNKAMKLGTTVDKIQQNIYDVVNLVEKSFGQKHHFKFLQAPMSVTQQAVLQLKIHKSQDNLDKTLLDACDDLGINLMGYGLLKYSQKNIILEKQIRVNDKLGRNFQLFKSLNKPSLVSFAIGMDTLAAVRSAYEIMSLPNTKDDIVEQYFNPNYKKMQEEFGEE